jgi:hypothetical protein
MHAVAIRRRRVYDAFCIYQWHRLRSDVIHLKQRDTIRRKPISIILATPRNHALLYEAFNDFYTFSTIDLAPFWTARIPQILERKG